MRYCCLGRIHHVCCLLPESPRLFHRHECLFLGGSGMKDVSAWQMSRRWDGLNELSSGRNEGVKTFRKKGTENNENRFTSSVRQRSAQRRRLAQDRDNTEYFLSGEATTLNTSWMEQNPRHALAALEKMVVPQTARH